MTNIKIVIKALQTLLLNHPGLSLLEGRVYLEENEIDALQGKKPFINICTDPNVFEIQQADNVRPYDMERHVYKFVLQYATQAKERQTALIGREEGGVLIQAGIYDLHEMICKAVQGDDTLGGVVDELLFTPSLATAVFDPLKDQLSFTAIAESSISYYRDQFKR